MSPASRIDHDWDQSHTLYVVLQGEFVLFREKTDNPDHDTLRILAPQVDLHQYKAGPWCQNWKNAEELPKDLYLHHAHGDRKQPTFGHSPRAIPEYNDDIIMHLGKETLHPECARLDIRAPMPLAILPGLSETTDNVVITVLENGQPICPAVPNPATLIPILLYEWYGDRRPFLSDSCDCDHHGRVLCPGGPDDFLSLHIFASSPEEDENSAHAKSAFRAAAALLGSDATIDWPDDYPFSSIPATPPAGLSPQQVNFFFFKIACGDPCTSAFLESHPDFFDPLTVTAGPSNNCGPATGGR